MAGAAPAPNGVTQMWLDVAIVALFAAGIYSFAVLCGWQTRLLSRRTNRRAEDMYDDYGDSPRRERRLAKDHPPSPR